MANSQITETGELRRFLANSLLGIKNGDLDIAKAAQITKMAAQINESLYAEVKVAAVQKAAGKEAAELGKLRLG